RDIVRNVKELMPVAVATGVQTNDPAYAAAENLAASADAVQAAAVYTALINAMAAVKPVVNFASALGATAVPDISNNIQFTLPAGVDLTAVTPAFETAGTAVVIDKTGAQDFSGGPVKYTLTANGVSNEYLVSINAAESAGAITSFALAGESGAISYNEDGDGTIVFDLTEKGAVDLNLVPDSVVFSGASIRPAAYTRQDFGEPVQYTVTAGDGTARTYTVIVFTESDPMIKTFDIDGMVSVIDHAAGTIDITGPYGYGSLASITPDVTINGDAYTPSGPVDFSAARTFTVTNGALSKSYVATVTIDDGLSAEITSFKIGSNAGVINHSAGTISIVVPLGEDLTDIIPAIEVPLGATYTPAGAVTFIPGEPITFRISSAAGTVKTYQATVQATEIEISANEDLDERLMAGSTVQFDAAITPPIIAIHGAAWSAVDAATDEAFSETTISDRGLLTIGADALGKYIKVTAVSADGVISNSLIVKVSNTPPSETMLRARDMDYGFGYYVIENSGAIGYTGNNGSNPEAIFVYENVDFTNLESIDMIRSFDGEADITLYTDLDEADNKTLLTGYNDTAGIPLSEYRRYTLDGVTIDGGKAVSDTNRIASADRNNTIDLIEAIDGLHTLYIRVRRASGTWAGNYDAFILNYDRRGDETDLPTNAAAWIEGDEMIVDVYNENDGSTDFSVIWAGYDEEGRLADVKTEYLSLAPNEVGRAAAPLWEDEPHAMMAFVWYKDSFVPYVIRIPLKY
ncbi:MAG: DUF5018 domain-containing protein, partial [Clostridiales bacterium]|nr:DUF5018 domain-containing protein [Clostridiales bacterium]